MVIFVAFQIVLDTEARTWKDLVLILLTVLKAHKCKSYRYPKVLTMDYGKVGNVYLTRLKWPFTILINSIRLRKSMDEVRSHFNKLLHCGCLLKIGDTSGCLLVGPRTVRIAVSK